MFLIKLHLDLLNDSHKESKEKAQQFLSCLFYHLI